LGAVLLAFVLVVGLMAEAAYRAAATYFPLLAQRKVSKGKGTLLPASFLRCSPVGCAAELTVLLRRCVQTTAASQMDEACAALAAHATPQAVRLGAGRRDIRESQRN